MESLTKTERMTEEKAALENDALNNEMNLKTLTAENKRLKAQINDLKSTKDGYKKRFLDSGHRNKKLSLKVRALTKEIERLEQVIKVVIRAFVMSVEGLDQMVVHFPKRMIFAKRQ